MNPTQKPVAILGAGLAGLTVAAHLHRQNVPFVLFEAGKRIAGLAASHRDAEGFTYDFGAHFITNRLAKAVGIADRCRVVPRYAETVWLGSRSYGYPFGLMRVPRFVMSAMARKLRLGKGKPANAAEWYRDQYGPKLANEVAIPLTEAWSGLPAEKLSLAVGESFTNSIFKTLFLKVAGTWTGKAVACGYSRGLPEKPSVWHVYPEGGISTLCEQLAENITDKIRLDSPVEAIQVDAGKVVAVESRGETTEVSAVVSTAPIPFLAKMVRGTDALAPFARFRYRPMVFVNLRLTGRGLLPDVVTWTPEKRFPFFRLTEPTLSMPWLAPEGKTIITVDIGCEVGDDVWKKDETALAEMCMQAIEPIIPQAKSRFLGSSVLRTPVAYPVFSLEYEAERQQLRDRGLGVHGLYTVGRNGEFSHIFMEDVHLHAQRIAATIAETIAKL